MPAVEKRTIEELMARYRFEPELADIFVEGLFDKDVLTEHIKHRGDLRQYVVYEIDTVQVPDEVLRRHNLDSGNKSSVLALARELSRLDGTYAYRCVVDRDLDHWFGPLETTPRLVWTDYCSIELYFFSQEFLHRMVVTWAQAQIDAWDGFFDSFVSVLRELYALRLSDRQLGCRIPWISFDRCLSHDGCTIQLDVDAYVFRVLSGARALSTHAAFQETTRVWRARLTADPREFVRGHDLTQLLAWVIRRFRGHRDCATEVSIARAFVILARETLELRRLVDALTA